jgi:DNA modification methylase
MPAAEMTEEPFRCQIVDWAMVPVDQLLANPKNYRRHPNKQRDALRGSLRELGIIDRVLVNKRTGYVLDGHARIEEYLSAGVPEAPVLFVDIPEEQEGLAILSLDPIAAMAVADKDVLESILKDAQTQEAGLMAHLKALAEQHHIVIGTPAEAPEPRLDIADELQKRWGTEHGQLWPIGAHRLLCGDSTNRDDVARLMDGQRAVLFATDPPYAVDYDGTNRPLSWGRQKKKGKEHAGVDCSESYKDWDHVGDPDTLYEDFCKVAKELAITEDAAWYCWHAGVRSDLVHRAWASNGVLVHQQIIWVKNRPVLSRTWYMWQHEPCFFGWVKGHKPKRCSEEFPKSVWELDIVNDGTSNGHPTSKPVEVFAIPMRQHTVEGEICYEPFCGSGSQIVAGEQLGRVVYGMELEPRYVAVTLERLAGMGMTPILERSSDA